jgi:predicted transcriptional regulator
MAELTIQASLWKKLVRLAQEKRRKPEAIATKALRDYLERQANEELLARSERAARKTQFDIEETEDLIRRYRRKKSQA